MIERRALPLLATALMPGGGSGMPPVGATFLQPLRPDFRRGLAGWEEVFHGLRAFGIRTLILQWSEIEELDLADDALARIMLAAHRAGAEIWIGTSYRSEWWRLPDAPPDELQAYFEAQQARLEERAAKLAAMLRQEGEACVTGWYVTEELDDMSWRRPERAGALRRFLTRQCAALSGIAPWPVAISVFANDMPAIDGFAGFMARLCEETGLRRVLVQDGTGAAGRSLEEARHLGEAFARAPWSAGSGFGMVVECFHQAAPGPPGSVPRITPASADEILARLQAANGLGTLPLTSFSHPHHLMPHGGEQAARVGRALLALR